MRSPFNRVKVAGALLLAGTIAGVGLSGASVVAARTGNDGNDGHVRHVLLISVDGLHASDVTKCLAAKLCPTLRALTTAGRTYANASASEPSDSSPGLTALVTGSSPKSSGVYYDDSYDRTMFPPPAQTASGTQDCTGTPGAEAMYFENIDVKAPTFSNPNGTRPIIFDPTKPVVDPAQLGRKLIHGVCTPVTPSDFTRVNSIFSVADAAGLRTAWADKHPSANGLAAGHGTPSSVDDAFQTEINADVIPGSLVDTRGRIVTFPLPNPTANPDGFFITDSVGDTESYDQIKVDAILNQIDGKTSAGTGHPGTPAIFGMNFQSVSVGQKLVDPVLSCARSKNAVTCDPSYVPGGYAPGSLAFTPQLAGAIQFVDRSLGAMVAELRATHQLSSTQIIISAKHGQSPINPATLDLIGSKEADVLAAAGIDVAFVIDDDVSLIWLKNQGQTAAAAAALVADKAGPNTARTDYVLAGAPLAARLHDPLIDARTPDLIVQPIAGTIYSTSKKKVAEHGGFAPNDVHVALIVVRGSALEGARMDNADGRRHGRAGFVVTTAVQTAQVAPTILAALGLDPNQLDGVRLEHTSVLPWH